MAQLDPQGVLRVVPGPVLEANLKKADEERAAAQLASSQPELTGLASFIRSQFEIMSRHRNSASGWGDRLLAALRAFNGEYEPGKLQQIKQFGGSEVYARIIAAKCRAASSLLRDVYLAPDRPWGLEPPADPDVPPEVMSSINMLVESETATTGMLGGGSISQDVQRDRVMQLMQAAREAAKKRATQQASVAEERLDEILTEGGFYKALADFIVDLPLFPFACIKGPVVRIVPTVVWQGGKAVVSQQPRLFWQRVSPFDIYFTSGVSEIDDASVIERMRYTRTDLNDLLDLPGYDHDAVRAVLKDYANGLHDNFDPTDTERATQENRESPTMNASGTISCLEFHGAVQGQTLLDQGMDPELISDPLRDYMVQAWLVGRHVIKVQLSPSPRKRHPYFITSFEKVPGTPVGNGLPDILSDVQDVCNASLRTLINNLSIASGPQVVVNVDRIAPDENIEDMYPWKRWRVVNDALGNNAQAPVSFFQPNSNAHELMSVYEKFNGIADELSAIPKYLSGQALGGAGRTAAGLAMLMGNASKILQTVAANIDRDVMDPALTGLFDMLMLTDTSGMLTGQETVKVMGVNVAVQRETQRARQIEFLTATANPIDAKILGPKGRAAVLREVSQGIGISGAKIVPTEEDLERMQQQEMVMQQQAMAEAGAAAQGSQTGQISTNDLGPRMRPSGGVH
jgi:hypothetical protein